jgi:hypothetical protein
MRNKFFVTILTLGLMVLAWSIFETQEIPDEDHPTPTEQLDQKPQVAKIESPAINHPAIVTASVKTVTVAATTTSSKNADDPRVVFSQKQRWLQTKIIDSLAVAQTDMILGKVDDKNGELDLSTISEARVEPSPTKLWDSPVIPILISPDLTNSQRVLDAIDSFNQQTVIRFVLLEDIEQAGEKPPKGWLVFQPNNEMCASFLGFQGGPQPIFINDECSAQGVRHEIMHALGFPHEQSRMDRDKFVDILWDNVDPSKYDQFALVPDALVHKFTGSVFNFNYQSIMLYPATAFSKDGQSITMQSKTSSKIAPIEEGLSTIDAERVNFLYGR